GPAPSPAPGPGPHCDLRDACGLRSVFSGLLSCDFNNLTCSTDGFSLLSHCSSVFSLIGCWRSEEPDLKDQPVLLYRDGHFDPDNHPSYRNRVDLKDVKDGDVSLILKNVTFNDRGTFECYVIQGGEQSRKKRSEDTESLSLVSLSVVPPALHHPLPHSVSVCRRPRRTRRGWRTCWSDCWCDCSCSGCCWCCDASKIPEESDSRC
uniref:Ig-like domain-containing protein n=1 Tax=Salarias fasciatus TaxID=181472 RepID=A0A672FPX8_SALFA